jgi:hypothetical protein
MKNKHLVIIFVLLVVAVYFSRKQFSQRERSFETTLIQADSNRLERVVFQLPNEEEFSLTRATQGWILSDGIRSVPANPEAVSKLLAAVSQLDSRHIAAKNKELWPVYGVSEKLGTRIQFFDDKGKIGDLTFGRDDFDPATQSVISFVRPFGELAVYVVDGSAAMLIGKSFDSYRNLVLAKMTRSMVVEQFSWQLPDTTFTFTKSDSTGWVLDGTAPLDSMEIEDYLNVFRNISADAFADDFDETTSSDNFHSRLVLKGQNISNPIVITCYTRPEKPGYFIFHSNQNPRAYFLSDSSGIFKKYAISF